jgi:hypothetical protein
VHKDHIIMCFVCHALAQGAVPLHWPLVNAPGHMLEVLGRQELEKKRQEDGAAYLLSLPGYRPREQEQLLREFLSAVTQLRGAGATTNHNSTSTTSSGSSWVELHPRLGHNNTGGSRSRGAKVCSTSPEADYGLSRFYMWGQTPAALLIAVYLPTGEKQCNGSRASNHYCRRCHPSSKLFMGITCGPCLVVCTSLFDCCSESK